MYAKLIPIVLAAAFVSPQAFAQSANPAPNAPRDAARATQTMSYKGEWRSSKLIGLDVYNQQNEKIGDIKEILIDPSGKVAGYVLGIGGLLGMGGHDVLLSPDKIKFVEEPRAARATEADRKRTTDTNTLTPPANRNASSLDDNRAATSGSAADRNTNRNDEMWVPDHAMVNLTKDQLKGMPHFEYSNYK